MHSVWVLVILKMSSNMPHSFTCYLHKLMFNKGTHLFAFPEFSSGITWHIKTLTGVNWQRLTNFNFSKQSWVTDSMRRKHKKPSSFVSVTSANYTKMWWDKTLIENSNSKLVFFISHTRTLQGKTPYQE